MALVAILNISLQFGTCRRVLWQRTEQTLTNHLFEFNQLRPSGVLALLSDGPSETFIIRILRDFLVLIKICLIVFLRLGASLYFLFANQTKIWLLFFQFDYVYNPIPIRFSHRITSLLRHINFDFNNQFQPTITRLGELSQFWGSLFLGELISTFTDFFFLVSAPYSVSVYSDYHYRKVFGISCVGERGRRGAGGGAEGY